MSTNKERAARAELALMAHQVDDCWGDGAQARIEIRKAPAAILSYLLADLRHWCDRKGLDYAKADKKGYEHYCADKYEARRARAPKGKR